MDYGRLPIDEQVAAFQAVLQRNQVLAVVLSRAAVLDLPDWYLVAGCLYQTVWNVVTGQPPEAGILDYDPMRYSSMRNHGPSPTALLTLRPCTVPVGLVRAKSPAQRVLIRHLPGPG
ncbi:MAG TPA: nucleotidyltransferase family protein [Streptosporangiaceae bacterium]|nr:nucleotidyltransferase family protein [Streptosporangiaceae bacterium]